MKKLGIIVNTKRPRAAHLLEQLKKKAEALGFELFAENQEMADLLGAKRIPVDQFGEKVDAALALGGDGTVLYTARILYGSDIPVMGINLGSLGFLTSVSDLEIDDALEALSTGACKVSERDVAECSIYQGGQLLGIERSLNDVVLGWGATSRIVTMDLRVDGEAVSSFMCDGMMVTTPTGSTGHSLSAGGPILHPGVGCFGVNVICPHTLSSRPLVLANTSVIEIEITNAAKALILSIDGQDKYRLDCGGRIKIRKSPHGIRFLQLNDHSYFSVLAQKLHWRGSSL